VCIYIYIYIERERAVIGSLMQGKRDKLLLLLQKVIWEMHSLDYAASVLGLYCLDACIMSMHAWLLFCFRQKKKASFC
jgi:hypothetical protein